VSAARVIHVQRRDAYRGPRLTKRGHGAPNHMPARAMPRRAALLCLILSCAVVGVVRQPPTPGPAPRRPALIARAGRRGRKTPSSAPRPSTRSKRRTRPTASSPSTPATTRTRTPSSRPGLLTQGGGRGGGARLPCTLLAAPKPDDSHPLPLHLHAIEWKLSTDGPPG
jgi:hypothetical protein